MSEDMTALVGYGLLALVTTLVLKPVIKFGKGFSSYLCVFGVVYAVVLTTAPRSYFEPNWFKFVGLVMAALCVITFIFLVWRRMKKQQEIMDLMEEE
ncbi:MAG: hypothetical protein CML39_01110 [Rhodobacteraceae bacterium]|nr:MAG: hypothetical protein CML39_01110 [Paracoccaceae bacterium]